MSSGSRVAVYVVLAHRDWVQVRRLARAILASSPAARVVVAYDSRSESFPTDAGDPRIDMFAHGCAPDWGSWALVTATLAAFSHARERFAPDLVTLVSGSDYPMRRLTAWEDEALRVKGWIGAAHELRYMPRWGRRVGEGDDRWTRYGYRWYRMPWSGWMSNAPGWVRRVQDSVGLRLEPVFSVRVVERGRGLYYGLRRLPSPFSEGMPCFLGDQWLALRRHELDQILDVDFAPRAALRRLYRRTVIPDESALVTALSRREMHAPLPPVTNVAWDVDGDGVGVWTERDLQRLLASGSPFCRKVERGTSDGLMDALDELVTREI